MEFTESSYDGSLNCRFFYATIPRWLNPSVWSMGHISLPRPYLRPVPNLADVFDCFGDDCLMTVCVRHGFYNFTLKAKFQFCSACILLFTLGVCSYEIWVLVIYDSVPRWLI